MITPLKSPPTVVLSGHPVWFVLQTDQEQANTMTAKIKLGWKIIAVEQSNINESGEATFEISEHLHENIHPSFPETMSARMQVNESLSKEFEIIVSDGHSDLIFVITAIKGKLPLHIEESIFENHESFLDYLIQTKSGLSFEKGQIPFYKNDQHQRIYFPCVSNISSNLTLIIRLQTNLELIDNGFGTLQHPGFGKVIEIDVSNYELILNYLLPTGHIPISFTAEIWQGAVKQYTSPNYVLEATPLNLKQFVFHNPAGGFDTISLKGNYEIAIETKTEVVNLLPTSQGNKHKLLAHLDTKDSRRAESGGLDKHQISQLAHLASSEKAYLCEQAGKPIPVIILDAKISVIKTPNTVHVAMVEYYLNLPHRLEVAGGSSQVNAAVTFSNITCSYNTDGVITLINATGGSGVFEYSLDNTNWQSSELFEALQNGTYFPKIRDKNNIGNVKTLPSVVLTLPEALEADYDVLHAGSMQETNGRITIKNPSGGSGVFEYSIGGTTWQTSPVFNNLSTKTYSVYMRDKNNPNCIFDFGGIWVGGVNYLDPLSATIVYYNPSAYGVNDGVIFLSDPTGGSGTGYMYSINNGGTWQASGEFNGLAAGTYHVKIKDDYISEALLEIVVLTSSNLATPTGFSVVQITQCDGPTLSWNSVANAHFYEYMRTSDENPVIVRRFASQVIDWEMDSHYTSSNLVSYKVRAGNAQSFSDWTAEVTLSLVCSGGTLYNPANHK